MLDTSGYHLSSSNQKTTFQSAEGSDCIRWHRWIEFYQPQFFLVLGDLQNSQELDSQKYL